MQRRQFLASTLAAGLLRAETEQPRTFVYKRTAGCEIKAGVEHQFVSVPDGAHGIGNISPGEQDRIYRDAAAFLSQRV